MSDAKKCDRCGNFYNMDDVSKRGKINNKVVNIIGAYQGGAVRCGYFDLCPECSQSFVEWFTGVRGLAENLPEEIDKEHSCKNCYYSKQSASKMPCDVCRDYSNFVEGGGVKDGI